MNDLISIDCPDEVPKVVREYPKQHRSQKICSNLEFHKYNLILNKFLFQIFI